MRHEDRYLAILETISSRDHHDLYTAIINVVTTQENFIMADENYYHGEGADARNADNWKMDNRLWNVLCESEKLKKNAYNELFKQFALKLTLLLEEERSKMKRRLIMCGVMIIGGFIGVATVFFTSGDSKENEIRVMM